MNNGEVIVTLTKCNNMVFADEIVSKLADNGIASSLHDELNDPAIGAYGPNPGIEVRVFKKNYEKSMHILKVINESRSCQLPWCPNCGSEKVIALSKDEGKRSKLAILFGIILIILGGVGLFLSNFIEGYESGKLNILVSAPFVLLFGVLLVLPKQNHQYYQCTECGKKFSR